MRTQPRTAPQIIKALENAGRAGKRSSFDSLRFDLAALYASYESSPDGRAAAKAAALRQAEDAWAYGAQKAAQKAVA
jgi:hypothetical protein